MTILARPDVCSTTEYFSLASALFRFRWADTDMRRLTTAIRSEQCVVRRFRRCVNVIDCTYTNLDSTAYYTPRLYGTAYSNKYSNMLYSMLFYSLL